MERVDTGPLKNQPYDESLDVVESEEIASVYSPTPRSLRQVTAAGVLLKTVSPSNYVPSR